MNKIPKVSIEIQDIFLAFTVTMTFSQVPEFIVSFAAILEKFLKPAPVTRDQIKMLLAGNSCENDTLYSIFDVELTSVEKGFKEYLRL